MVRCVINVIRFWDYLSSNPESVHQVMHLFSDRGTPYSLRHMNGYSGHTYKFTKPDGTFHYVQIHLKTDQGSKTLTNDEAVALSASNPDHATEDLFNAIERKEYPSWTVYVQVMTPEQAENFKYSIFDLTKTWPQKEYPLRRFGKLTLKENPKNYFAEIEQAAFSPSHLVPGIEPSADPVMQSRLFSYPDTHRHRLGTNYQQIPANRPLNEFNPFQRDGAMRVDGNLGSNPNYQSSFHLITYKPIVSHEAHEKWVGTATNFQFKLFDEDYEQATALWHVLGRYPGQQDNFVGNVSGHLKNARKEVRNKTYEMFGKVDKKLGERICKATEENFAKGEDGRRKMNHASKL
jgi:catalase